MHGKCLVCIAIRWIERRQLVIYGDSFVRIAIVEFEWPFVCINIDRFVLMAIFWCERQ